ncbi:MAG: amino acid permease [Candidatus Thermoplasmatota archaeon]
MSEAPQPAGVKVKLRRDLGLLEITMIGLGPTIGSTIFLLVGLGVRIAGPALVLVFALNFLVTIFTAMAYAELASAFSDTGGGYLWVKEGMPQPFGFLSGWMSWFGHSIVTSFYILGFGFGVIWILDASGASIPGVSNEALIKPFAVIACLVFIYVNYRGTKITGRSSLYVTTALAAIVGVYIIAGLVTVVYHPPYSQAFEPFLPQGWESIIIAMGFTFIVFEGYEIIAQCGEECTQAEKNVPRASWICISVATAIFVLVAIVTIGVMGWTNAAAAGEHAVARAADIALPHVGAQLIGIGIILGTLAAINSTLFSSSRVAFAMGRDGALPSIFGRLHQHRHTPHVAVLVSGAMIIMMTIFLPITAIAAAADIMFLLLMTFVNVAVITLRIKKPEVKRRYLIPFFPMIPVIGLITKGVLAVSLYWYSPVAWYIALGWMEIGLFAYYLYGGKEQIERPVPEMEPERVEREKYRILIPVASEADMPLVELGALIAQVESGEMYIINVIELPESVPITGASYKEVSLHSKVLEQAKKVAARGYVHKRTNILVARNAAGAILDEIKDEDVNLLIVGWKGKAREDVLYGRNLDYLLTKANCDVLLFKSAGMPKEMRRILVISTPEWHVSYATGFAVLMAKRDSAEITIMGVCSDKGKAEEESGYLDRLSMICATHEVAHQTKLVVSASPLATILASAEDFDLVVLGVSEGGAGIFGTLQDKIARRVKKPVLVMKKVERKEPQAPASAPGS